MKIVRIINYKFIFTLIIMMLIMSQIFLGQNVYATTGVSVNVNGEKVIFTQEPIIKDGRTLVPLRAIFEALGMNVDWDQETKGIIAYNESVIIKLQIGNKFATVGNRNSEVITTALDVVPQIFNNSTLVPVRFISEASGADVIWEQSTKTVYIKSNSDRYFCDMYDAIENDATVTYMGYRSHQSGFQDGFGLGIFSNGDIYTGNFSNGIFKGQGSYVFSDETVYSGNWVDGRPEGLGTLVYPNGDVYIGNFVKGIIEGQGTYYYSTTDNYYVGEMRDGLKNGEGTFTWNDGTKYIGNWINDQRSGFGELYLINGENYSGQWIDETMNGYGRYTFDDGSYYEGNFENGYFVSGTKYDNIGTITNQTDVEIESITVNNLVLKKGYVHTLQFSVYPIDADKGRISITSSNPSVVLVWDNIRTLQPLNTGTAIITLKAPNGVTSSCIVEVIE